MDDLEEKFHRFASLHNAVWRLGQAAETHWYFVEAATCFRAKSFLASALCSFNALESSMRWIQKRQQAQPYLDLDTGNLNHELIRKTQALGYRVDVLAFPGESNFLTKIGTSQKPYVELVRQRNNICHGNVVEYFQTVPSTGDTIFTLECVRDLASNLLGVCEAWTKEVQRHREASVQAASAAPQGGV